MIHISIIAVLKFLVILILKILGIVYAEEKARIISDLIKSVVASAITPLGATLYYFGIKTIINSVFFLKIGIESYWPVIGVGIGLVLAVPGMRTGGYLFFRYAEIISHAVVQIRFPRLRTGK